MVTQRDIECVMAMAELMFENMPVTRKALWKDHQATKQLAAHVAQETRTRDELLIEKEAELIYLRLYGKLGAVWSANESKEVWRDKARAALANTAKGGE